MNAPIRLHGRHAIKLFLSTDLKARLAALAESLDRPLADVCRQLLWMALPMVEGMQSAQQRGTRWWLESITTDAEDRTGRIEDIA